MDSTNGNNKSLVLAVVGLVALGGFGYFYMRGNQAVLQDDTLMEIPSSTNTPTPAGSAPSQPAMMEKKEDTEMSPVSYKNGVYNVTGNYTSPGGPESIGVTLTLTDGKVTSAEVVSNAELPASKLNQAKFISGYEVLVVGKSIDEIKLDKVAGSSLTPKGFMDALEKVKSQAKS